MKSSGALKFLKNKRKRDENALDKVNNKKPRKCNRCTIEKKVSEFGLKTKNKDGVDSICLACHKRSRLLAKLKMKKQVDKDVSTFNIDFRDSMVERDKFVEVSSAMGGFFKVFKLELDEDDYKSGFLKDLNLREDKIYEDIVDFLESINMDQSFIVDFEIGMGFLNGKTGKEFKVMLRLKNKKLAPLGKIYIYILGSQFFARKSKFLKEGN
jgi:hypothetical protein